MREIFTDREGNYWAAMYGVDPVTIVRCHVTGRLRGGLFVKVSRKELRANFTPTRQTMRVVTIRMILDAIGEPQLRLYRPKGKSHFVFRLGYVRQSTNLKAINEMLLDDWIKAGRAFIKSTEEKKP